MLNLYGPHRGVQSGMHLSTETPLIGASFVQSLRQASMHPLLFDEPAGGLLFDELPDEVLEELPDELPLPP
jgi:hypothetical protein